MTTRHTRRRFSGRWGWTLLLAATAGCGAQYNGIFSAPISKLFGHDEPQQVQANQFYSTPRQSQANRSINETPYSKVDQPGQLLQQVGPQDTPPAQGTAAVNRAAAGTEGQRPDESNISPVVSTAIKGPGPEGSPATQPDLSVEPATTQPIVTVPATEPGISSGQYMTLGGVVAEVNGSPIFANKVLQLLGPTLRDLARQTNDPDRFARGARDQIDKQVGELIRNELDYAAAQRNLGAQDRGLVDSLTASWRRKQITDAGGSVEVARRRAIANGESFDDLVNQQNRLYTIQLYYQRRFLPRVEVGAADMRRYYQEHIAEFSAPAIAAFRVIHIDPAQLGNNQALMESKAADLLTRAKRGDDFVTLFKEFNNDAGLAVVEKDGEQPITVNRGSFRVKEVDDAAWKLQPGQVSDLIRARNSIYLVKLDTRKEGQQRAFEDEAVQDQLRFRMRNEQLIKLREQEQDKLVKNAIIRTDESMMDLAVEMAMQNYHQWASAK